jgi:hypothetical protein
VQRRLADVQRGARRDEGRGVGQALLELGAQRGHDLGGHGTVVGAAAEEVDDPLLRGGVAGVDGGHGWTIARGC